MADNNYLPFNMQENGGIIQGRFIQQRMQRQALALGDMSMASSLPNNNNPLTIYYQNPHNSTTLPLAALAAPTTTTTFHASSSLINSGTKLLGVGRSSYMINKLHQARAGRAAARASCLRRLHLINACRKMMNHQQRLPFGGGARPSLTCFDQDDNVMKTSNLLERCGVEIRGGGDGDEDDDKLKDGVEEQDDGLDLRLKL